MELGSRKLQILKAVIDEYIASASPVGSRSLSRYPGINLSSATIRNEMADLEEMGYLEQPHTSAGRIPSEKAYRLYVNSMMQRSNLTEEEIRSIRGYYTRQIDEVESVIRSTAVALSEVTQYTAVILKPELQWNRLRHIQLVPLAMGRALLVVVTDAGFSRDAIIRVPERLQSDDLDRISRLLTERLYDCRMDLVGEKMIRVLNDELQERGEFLNSLVATMERSMQPKAGGVELSGATNMLHYPEYSDMNKARSFLMAVEGKDALYDLLKRARSVEFTVTIGSENEIEPLQDCSIVTATYRIDETPVGSFGVIGPTRMNYGKVISVLEYMSKGLSKVLSISKEEERSID